MQTINDLLREISNIQSAANDLTIKGNRNAQIVVYINEKCASIAQMIQQVVQEIQNGNQTTPEQASDQNKEVTAS